VKNTDGAFLKISRQEFLDQPRKAVTLIGMSGVGKTYISGQLEVWGWKRYSCDFEIGTKYLRAALTGFMKNPEDMDALFKFIGKPGNPKKGGSHMKTYKVHQRSYYEAECMSVAEAVVEAENTDKNFVHDSTGSLCEIMDDALISRLGTKTLFVYLKASAEEENVVLERARSHPKPLFFPPALFDGWVQEYLTLNNLSVPEEMEPDDFSRWVFPKLFTSRLPKYQGLADQYGVTIDSGALHHLKNENDFIARIAEKLDA
jgi:hypothetical protein